MVNDIDPVFLKERRVQNWIAVVYLVVVLGILLYPVIKDLEALRYLPQFMPNCPSIVWIIVLVFCGSMIAIGIYGRREEGKQLQQLRVATRIYRQSTPRAVTVHRWRLCGANGQAFYLSIYPHDAPSQSPAQVLRPMTRILQAARDETQTVLWYTGEDADGMDVLRFADGTVMMAQPVTDDLAGKAPHVPPHP